MKILAYLKKYSIFLFFFLICILYLYRNTITESFQDKDTIYINNGNATETEVLYPILKNVFPNKNIKFVDSNDVDLLILSQFESPPPNIPYIFFNGEIYDRLDKNKLNDKNSMLQLLTTNNSNVKDLKNCIHFPFFLSLGRNIYDASPFYRNYNNTRSKLAAYIASNSLAHRNDMFKALSNLDSTVESLGNANKTNNIKLPEKWWDLPEVYKDYKFGFAMENTDEDGYITEKIMNVYRGGAIPIYWGTNDVTKIFNSESFVNVKDYSSYEECAKDIIAIRDDEERYEAMRNAPIFVKDSKYSSYWDEESPQWVKDIATNIKKSFNIDGF